MTDFIYQIADRYVTEDVIPCLGDNGIDLPTYRDVVLKRFTNPHIQDTNQRVAADGFSKIPAMIAPTLRECYQRGVRPNATAMLPALFSYSWSSGITANCPMNIRMASLMHQLSMQCSSLPIPSLFMPVIKRCLAI